MNNIAHPLRMPKWKKVAHMQQTQNRAQVQDKKIEL